MGLAYLPQVSRCLGEVGTPSFPNKPPNSPAGSQDIEKHLQCSLTGKSQAQTKSSAQGHTMTHGQTQPSPVLQCPAPLGPQASVPRRGPRGTRIQDVDGAWVSWVPSLPHPSAPPPPLPRSIRLLTFTTDPKRHLIPLSQLPQLHTTCYPGTPHTRPMMSSFSSGPTQASGVFLSPTPNRPSTL